MNPLKKLLGQTAIYGLSSIVGRVLNFLLVPLYTDPSIFSKSEYGVVTDLYALVAFFIIILTYGMETAFFRFLDTKKVQNQARLYSTSLISILSTSTLFLLIIIVFQQYLADIMKYPTHPEYILWFAWILVLDAVAAIPFANLRAQGKAVKFATLKFINIGVNIGLNLFFILLLPYIIKHDLAFAETAKSIYNPNIGVGYIFIANLIASAVVLVLLMPSIIKINWVFDKVLWKKLVLYGLPLLIAGLAGVANETLDRQLLKYMLPDDTWQSTLGVYGANYKLAVFMTLFIQAFRFGAEPFFFANAKEKNAKQMYALVMKYFVLFVSFIFLALIAYLDIVKGFIGSSYHEGLKIVPILLLANLCLGIYYNLSIWFKLTDKTRYGAYLSGGGAVITIVMNVLLIPKIGYMGSAWATLGAYGFMMVAAYYTGQKHYPIKYPIRTISVYLFTALALASISFWISRGNILVNTALIIIFVLLTLFIEKNTKKNEFKN